MAMASVTSHCREDGVKAGPRYDPVRLGKSVGASNRQLAGSLSRAKLASQLPQPEVHAI